MYTKERELGRKLVAAMPEQPEMARMLAASSLYLAEVTQIMSRDTPPAVLRAILQEGRAPLLKFKKAGKLPPRLQKLLADLEAALAKLEK